MATGRLAAVTPTANTDTQLYQVTPVPAAIVRI